jgi:hypothetical protein
MWPHLDRLIALGCAGVFFLGAPPVDDPVAGDGHAVPSGLPITEFNSACTQAVQPVPTGSWRGANRGSDVPPECAREPIGFSRGADGIFAPEALDSAKAAKLDLGSA